MSKLTSAYNKALDDINARKTVRRIRDLESRVAELEAENANWKNGGYTNLWKQRTEDRDRAIERQRLTLLDLREQLAAAQTAIQGVIDWDKRRKFIIPYKVRDPLHTVLKEGQ